MATSTRTPPHAPPLVPRRNGPKRSAQVIEPTDSRVRDPAETSSLWPRIRTGIRGRRAGHHAQQFRPEPHTSQIEVGSEATGLEEASSELQGDAPAKTEWVIREGVTATCDEKLTTVVLENLLHNAAKFTRHSKAPRIEFGVDRSTRPEPVYFVRDNGAGFDAANAVHFSEPFQKFHRDDEFEGSGLGLAEARRIVRRHGGNIWANSQPGAGAELFFTLGTEAPSPPPP